MDLGDIPSEDAWYETFARLEDGNYIANVLENTQSAYIRRQGRFHCYRLLITPPSPCECDICSQQYRSEFFQRRWVFGYSKVFSDEDAHREAAGLVERFRRSIEYLQRQCETNGSAIFKRWKKKSSEKRKALLLEVDPDMYQYQWSDVRFRNDFAPIERAIFEAGDSWSDPDITQGRARRNYRNICLLPYMNLESLKDDPARLLNILHNRVKYSPEQWAPYDNYLIDKQWKIGAFSTIYNKNAIVMYGSNYGKLTIWEEKAAHACDIIGFPRGILILEAQAKLAELLKAIVERILEGIGESKESSTLGQTLGLGLKNITERSNFIELAAIYLNQPFSSPPNFDIKLLLSISQAQVNFHGDHLWLLQTDPLSLRRYTAQVLEGGMGENLTIRNKHVRTALKLMEDAMIFWTWQWILQEVQKIQDIHSKHQICRGKPLPPDYERSIGCLEALLFDLCRRRAKLTYQLLPTHAGFSNHWNVEYMQRLQTMIMYPQKKSDLDTSEFFFKDRLHFCLAAICEMLAPPPELFHSDIEYWFHEPSDLFAILDEHLSTCMKTGDKKEMARLDEILYSLYSDLSALLQILFMVRLHRPHVQSTPKLEEAIKSETGKAWRYMRAGYLDQDHREANSKLNTENADEKIKAQQLLADFMGKFLATPKPTGSRATQKWLDQDEAQRAASSALWRQMRSRHEQTLKRLKIGSDDIKADMKILSADQTPEYISAVQSERTEILARIAAQTSHKTAKKIAGKPNIQTQWGLESINTESSLVQESKIKVKTRSDKPIKEPDLSVANLTITNQDSESTQVKFGVSKRTLDIMQSLFPKSNFEERTKNVDWVSFVQAMSEVGFSARQQHGSQFSFEPISTCPWFGRGRIVFHKPHPEPKYEAWKLLGIGKRMTKWFGWDANTFELLESKPEAE